MRQSDGRTVPHAAARWHTRDMTRVTLVAGLCALAAAGRAWGGGDAGRFECGGFGVQPGERVQGLLTVNARQYWRSTVAAGNGTFRASFQASLGPCGRFVLRALGSRGSRVRVLQRRLI